MRRTTPAPPRHLGTGYWTADPVTAAAGHKCAVTVSGAGPRLLRHRHCCCSAGQQFWNHTVEQTVGGEVVQVVIQPNVPRVFSTDLARFLDFCGRYSSLQKIGNSW